MVTQVVERPECRGTELAQVDSVAVLLFVMADEGVKLSKRLLADFALVPLAFAFFVLLAKIKSLNDRCVMPKKKRGKNTPVKYVFSHHDCCQHHF